MMITYRQLVRQVQRGDIDAIQEIIEGFTPHLTVTADQYKYLFEDFDEAFAVATSAVIESIYAYDLLQAVPVQFCVVAAIRNRIRQEQRGIQKYQDRVIKGFETDEGMQEYPPHMMDTNQLSPEETYICHEELYLLARAKDTLARDEAEVIRLKYTHGYSDTRIGEAMQLSTYAVRKLHGEAKEKIREYMREKK